MAEVFAQNQKKFHTSAPSVVDGSNSPITVKFDGRNYGMWSQMVEVHLRSKNKFDHVSSSRTAPHQEDPAYAQWEVDDNTVKAWLLNSLDQSLLGNFLIIPTAKEVWDAIKTAFFDGSDGTRIYEL
jgi:gag-polypeptide of LTR copia-type